MGRPQQKERSDQLLLRTQRSSQVKAEAQVMAVFSKVEPKQPRRSPESSQRQQQ